MPLHLSILVLMPMDAAIKSPLIELPPRGFPICWTKDPREMLRFAENVLGTMSDPGQKIRSQIN